MRDVVGVVFACGLVVGCGTEYVPVLEVHTSTTALAFGQDGDGPWRQIELDQGNGELLVDSSYYGVAIFCPGQTPYIVLDTASAAVIRRCSEPPTTTIHLSGAASPGSDIYVGARHVSTGTDTTYAIDLVPGKYDVFATTGAAGFQAIDVDLTRDLQLDVIATNPFVETPLEITGIDPGEEVVVSASVSTPTMRAPIYSGPPPLLAFENVALGSGQAFAASAHGCLAQQAPAFEGTIPRVEIPAAMTADVDHAQATWSAGLRDWEFMNVSIGGTTALTIRARTRWFDKRGGDVLPAIDPATFEGWSPELGGGFAPGEPVTMHMELTIGQLFGEYASCSVDKTYAW